MDQNEMEKLIVEGINISKEVDSILLKLELESRPNGDLINSHEACDMFDRYNIWRVNIKNFVQANRIPLPQSAFIYLSDSVPLFKGGAEYGFVNSKKSLKLLDNIKQEAINKVTKLTELSNIQSTIKINIFISHKKGVYISEATTYPIRGARRQIIRLLGEKETMNGNDFCQILRKDMQFVSKSISEINRIFLRIIKPGVSEGLIKHNATGGYELNRGVYKINSID